MSEENNAEKYHANFISLLEKKYGDFNPKNRSFTVTSNSKIARDLCYSDSQFSRLVNNTASEGEFVRALRNVNRLLNEAELEENQVSSPSKKKSVTYIIILLVLLLVTTIGVLTFYLGKSGLKDVESVTENYSRYEMLQWSFENKYIKPYVKLKELPEDCNYPCYKYQGKWVLKDEYKIPFFREKNGFHYVAKDAYMYVRCMDERDNSGTSFEGYEYQKHEIWYDRREMPIDSFLTDDRNPKVREDYNSISLENEPDFIKLAYVHTFFRNEFTLDSTLIERSGKVIGRDIEFLSDKLLQERISSSKLIAELKNEVNSIAKNRLEDFSKPVSCEPTKVPQKDFHLVNEGDKLNFSCQFTTGRFLVDYNKVFVLEEQYINNYCR